MATTRTNPIGTGTRNASLNAPEDFWAAIGQAASRSGVSMGEYIRDLCAKGAWLTDPALAKSLCTTLATYYPDKRQVYAIALTALFALQTAMHWCGASRDEIRRAPGRVRVVRNAERGTRNSEIA